MTDKTDYETQTFYVTIALAFLDVFILLSFSKPNEFSIYLTVVSKLKVFCYDSKSIASS